MGYYQLFLKSSIQIYFHIFGTAHTTFTQLQIHTIKGVFLLLQTGKGQNPNQADVVERQNPPACTGSQIS